MLVEELSDYGQWWLQTLKASLEKGFKKRRPMPGATVTVARSGLKINAPGKSTEVPAGPHGEMMDAAALARTIRQAGATVIALEPDRHVIRKLSPMRMPASRARSMATLDMASMTPFRSEEVYCLILESDPREDNGSTGYAIIRRNVLDPVLNAFKAAGTEPTALVLLGSPQGSENSYRVSAADLRALQKQTTWRARILPLTWLLLFAAAIATYIHIDARFSSAEEVAAAPLSELEEKARRIRTELNNRMVRIKEINALRQNLSEQSSMTEVWEELSRVLPDDAYITDLSINGTDMNLRGFSAAAASIIEPLEDSDLFYTAKFSSAVVKVPGQDGEQFEISIELAER